MTASRRRAARTVTDEIFRRIVTWFAPILCFTMEEAWTTRFGMDDSVHLQDFFADAGGWANPGLIEKWTRIRELRRVVTGALELARADKTIGSSLEAAPVLLVSDAADKALFDIGRSGGNRHHLRRRGGSVPQSRWPLRRARRSRARACASIKATGEKCARCWRVLEEVTATRHPSLQPLHRCGRRLAE